MREILAAFCIAVTRGDGRIHAAGGPGRTLPMVRRLAAAKSDGARNCGFVSCEQCMETVRGMGGFCDRNLFYTGPEERPVRRSRKHDD